MSLWSDLIRLLSSEWLLDNRTNGGSIIILRSLISSTILFIVTILIFNATNHEQINKPLKLELIHLVHVHFTWFGAMFASIYAALYARFASQWSYLANLYNNIKQTSSRKDTDTEVIAEWKAGFIEDAEYLHLALKENFASIIYHWGQEEQVKNKYINNTPGGEKRYYTLMTKVQTIYTVTCHRYW